MVPPDSNNQNKNRMGLRLVKNTLSEYIQQTSQIWSSTKIKKRNAKSLERPRTAKLERPRLLNEDLKQTVDMTLMTKELLKINLSKPEFITQKTITKNDCNENFKQSRINKIVDIRDIKNKHLNKSKTISILSGTDKKNHIYMFGHTLETSKTGENSPSQNSHEAISCQNTCASKTYVLLPGRESLQNANGLSISQPTNSTPKKKPLSHSPYLEKNSQSKRSHEIKIKRSLSAPKKRLTQTCHVSKQELKSESLVLHETKCSQAEKELIPPNNKPVFRQSTVECYICKREFGSHSIHIHQPQCLKKWNAQNDLLPLSQRSRTSQPENALDEKSNSINNNDERKRVGIISMPSYDCNEKLIMKPTVSCYLCDREFIPKLLKIHEPECLKRWHTENNKLPFNQRKKQPLRPDIIFTDEGNVNFEATFERIWNNHLDSLVQCHKCNRTFFPERVEQHIRACTGSQKLLK